MVDLDHLVPGVIQPSRRDRARERRRAMNKEPSDDSSQRDRPEGHVQNQFRNGSRLALSCETVAQSCHERCPVEREVKADGGHHDQPRQPVQVQLGEAGKAERRCTKGSLARMKAEEQYQSAGEGQERSEEEDDIEKGLEVLATHAPHPTSPLQASGRPTDEPCLLADER